MELLQCPQQSFNLFYILSERWIFPLSPIIQRKRWIDKVAGKDARLLKRLHSHNCEIWNHENITRNPDSTRKSFISAQRGIHKENAARCAAVEDLDERILKWVGEMDESAEPNSESPGMILDRLSIFSLKESYLERQWWMENTVLKKNKVEALLHSLQSQIHYLKRAYSVLLAECTIGRARFIPYRSFKIYS